MENCNVLNGLVSTSEFFKLFKCCRMSRRWEINLIWSYNHPISKYTHRSHFGWIWHTFRTCKSGTRLFPDMWFSLKNAQYRPRSTCRKSQKTNGDFSRYSRKGLFLTPVLTPFSTKWNQIGSLVFEKITKTPFLTQFDPHLTLYLENQKWSGLETWHKYVELLHLLSPGDGTKSAC